MKRALANRTALPSVNRGAYPVQVRMTLDEAVRLERLRLALGLRCWSDVFLHLLAQYREAQ